MNRPVVAYVRVSSDGQENGDGFTRQLAAIHGYAEKNGCQIIQVFKEVKTGTSDAAERPAMSEMIEFLREHRECTTAVIEKLDRLARDVVIQEGIIGKFLGLNLTVVSTCEPDLCSNDPSRVFVRQILGAVAQLDRSLIVAKLKSARERKKAETGRCEGQKPYGMKDGERATLELMRTYRNHHGKCDAHIADLLNTGGIKPRTGKKWYPATVAKILNRHGAIYETMFPT